MNTTYTTQQQERINEIHDYVGGPIHCEESDIDPGYIYVTHGVVAKHDIFVVAPDGRVGNGGINQCRYFSTVATMLRAIQEDAQHINPDDIKPGLRVRLTSGIDAYPHFGVPAGRTGTVTDVTDDLVSVKMDEHIDGAEEWDNEVCWSDDDGYNAGGTTAAYAAAFDLEAV